MAVGVRKHTVDSPTFEAREAASTNFMQGQAASALRDPRVEHVKVRRIVIVILIAGIFPRASSNGAHGSQSDDSTYLVSDMRCSLYLTLDQQVVFSVARITGVANLPPKDVV